MPNRTMLAATLVALISIATPLASMQAERKIYKVSDGGIVPPKPIERPNPAYTDEARDAKIEGQVTLSVVIEANGILGDIKVVSGLDRGLDANAVKALERWTFEPAQKEGRPVAVAAEITVRFRLL